MGQHDIIPQVFEKFIRQSEKLEHDQYQRHADGLLLRINRRIIAPDRKLSRHLIQRFIFANLFRHFLDVALRCRKINPEERARFFRFLVHRRFAHSNPHRLISQDSRTIRPADREDRRYRYPIPIGTLDRRHNAGVVIHAALQHDMLPDPLRSDYFMQIILHDRMAQTGCDIRLAGAGALR